MVEPPSQLELIRAHDRGNPDVEDTEEDAPLLELTSASTEEPIVKALWDDVRPHDRTMALVSVSGLFVLTAITCSAVFSKDPPPRIWFALHPPLSTLSLLLFGLGIITLQPISKADVLEKERGLIRHQAVVLALALPTFVLGFFTIWYHRQSGSAHHYMSWHEIMGLIAFISVLVHVVVGAGMVWFDGHLFGGGDKAKRLYKYHRLAGYALFLFMLLIVHNGGAWSHWFVRNTNGFVRFVGYTLAPLAVAVGMAMRIRLSKMGLTMPSFLITRIRR